MLTDADRVPLAARAWLGDGAGGALVAQDGTVDWYTRHRLDELPALGRLLDPSAGAVRVGLVRDGTGARRRLPTASQAYRPGTLVVDTEQTAAGAALRITDLLPWPGPSDTPPGRLVRIVTARTGPADVEIEVIPGSGLGPARQVSSWSHGLVMDGTAVRTEVPLRAEPLDRDHPRWRGVRRLDAGESLVITIDDAGSRSHRPLSLDAARRMVEDTSTAWRSWLATLVYDGPYRDALERSALTVRSLTSTRYGGPVAAGTLSLVRRPGGERTEDNRVVRWRDAAGAARILAELGFPEDAEAAEAWLRLAAESHPLPWPPTLDPAGQTPPEREELRARGWRAGQPVVVGQPTDLVNHDLYADVVGAVSACRRGPWGVGGDGPLVGAWSELVQAADWLADHWQEPDAGVWANAGQPVRLVASAVQAAVALHRTTRRARAKNPLDLAAAAWQQSEQEIVRWIERNGVAPDGGLRRDPSAEHPDAALLRVAWQGPWPVEHPIVARTVDRILEQLSTGLLLHRLPDGVDGKPGPDSPDLVASLWAVKSLARLSRWEEGHERLEGVLDLAGPVGLLSDAADPQSGQLFSDYPSAATHLALIDAALALTAGPR